MNFITDIETLDALYPDPPSSAAQRKVAGYLTPLYRDWIMASRFCVLSTVGPEGTDGSPRGDDGPVVSALDPHTLLMPDWRGNNRIDSLRNIVRDGRVSLMFLVTGSTTIVRVNGQARLTAAPEWIDRFEHKGRHPRCVIVIKIAEVYAQCARAVMRASLWCSGGQSADLPSFGDILNELTKGDLDGAALDRDWPARAAKTMW